MKAGGMQSFQAGFLLRLLFDPEDGGDVSSKRRLIFNGLHVIIYHKIITLLICIVDYPLVRRFNSVPLSTVIAM
jgi:hypothetical protein